jgi:hypothetical protein
VDGHTSRIESKDNILFSEMFEDASQITVFSYELERRFGPDAFDRFEIIASEENAKVNELSETGR